MSEALYGTTTLVVGARTYTLQPTLEAALLIESRFGGLRAALEAMRLMSIGASADIIVAGAGLKPEQHTEVANGVFQTGVAKVSAELTAYLTVLLNPVPPSVAARGKPEADSTAQ
ncbi:hypothetical protein WR25_00993 [Diploscapter pachys]|uniref:Uncharacterized protein n=1 Tax=Diploscapter pachys TaxID=2018661 RepID=A0A2A2K0V1_9BILA|nr:MULTISPECIES: hypothetical protein [unclassified Pseudomonas]MDH0300626.1 hypothetical protein [Pseudomonas sp. GD04091]MDH1984223.1 hypothetical protein [Pseudomonas sp. GD03689]PAV67646.1 hypothetical protein WR25_00993 [Diploscapter pachys]